MIQPKHKGIEFGWQVNVKSMFVKNIKVCDKHGFLFAKNMWVIKKQNLKTSFENETSFLK